MNIKLRGEWELISFWHLKTWTVGVEWGHWDFARYWDFEVHLLCYHIHFRKELR